MPALPLTLPSLPSWAQQLGGTLPLSALIEFIDIATKMHLYELSGCVPLWNWPITPIGARLLLSLKDTNNSDTCCLDRIGQSPALDCFDGRHGDHYPCSAPATTRLWASATNIDVEIPNTHPNMRNHTHSRQQKLDVLHISQINNGLQKPPPLRRPAFSVSQLVRTMQERTAYRLVSVFGWLFWVGITIVSALSQLYIATAYLLMMPTTGVAIAIIHGNKPRQLLLRGVAPEDRMIIASDNTNASTWWAFYGKNYPLNSLVNTPFTRKRENLCPPRPLAVWGLRVLILGQWAAALGSCCVQDWNALFISLWIIFCAFVTSHLTKADRIIKDWVTYDCHVRVKRIRARFSSRRALLSALVYLNPDSKDGRSSWMDSILSPASSDRRDWELALFRYIRGETQADQENSMEREYWEKFIVEGVDVGRRIKQELEKDTNLNTGEK